MHMHIHIHRESYTWVCANARVHACTLSTRDNSTDWEYMTLIGFLENCLH